ncbi:MAG TPA: ribosome-associated translation inhibitor RaiA [Oscillospiraceae bacterium]|nr:ribosome-associated translation inhibitor RaiA [Oscillospiraceae bacterium]
MDITIVGRKCTIRDSFKERVEKKLSKIKRIFGDDSFAKVTVTVEKTYQSVEITVTKSGMIFRAEERAENMNDALDACVNSLVRQIRKNKTKLEKRIRQGALDAFSGADDFDEETEFDLVRVKSVSLKPQSSDEAILQMNMLDHLFYMFLNSSTNHINVVYRRKDGGYGLIEPDIE